MQRIDYRQRSKPVKGEFSDMSKGNQLIFSVVFGIIIIALILTGFITGLNQFILSVIPLISFLISVLAIINKKIGFTFGSSIISGLLVGLVILLWGKPSHDFHKVIGTLLTSFGVSCVFIYILFSKLWKVTYWWIVIPAGVGLSTGACYLFSSAKFIDFVFYIGIGLGASLMFWGLGTKLLGLIIAGSIVLTVAPGVTFSWKSIGIINPVSQTGVMLVWFGLGWALITVSSRVIGDKFTWWPLIPGGILEMVGLGLYLGGNPNMTESFLTNTTIMSLLLFGSYVILMRLNFRK